MRSQGLQQRLTLPIQLIQSLHPIILLLLRLSTYFATLLSFLLFFPFVCFVCFPFSFPLPVHSFVPALHRHSLGGINKPDPRVALHVLEQWDVLDASQIWFVGDSEDDMKCGRAAGCRTCLIATQFNGHILVEYPDLVDLSVQSLAEFGKAIDLM